MCVFFSQGKELDYFVIEQIFITQGNFDELFHCCFSISVEFLFIYFWCVAESGFCPLPPVLVIHVFCAMLKLWSGGLLFCNKIEECFFFLYQEQVNQQKAMASRTSPMRTSVPRGGTSSLDSTSNSRVQQQQPRGSSGQQLQGLTTTLGSSNNNPKEVQDSHNSCPHLLLEEMETIICVLGVAKE